MSNASGRYAGRDTLNKAETLSNEKSRSKKGEVYSERIEIAMAVYDRIVRQDWFLPYTCAGSSAVLQGVMRHFGHHVGRTGVTPVEQGPGGMQVHVVTFDDRYVYDLTYTQFRRLCAFDSPIIRLEQFETRFLLLSTLDDPLMCEDDFYTHYFAMLGDFQPQRSSGPP
ncbi:hypothetical protein ACFL0Q_05095 [Thermodesulfobacteriota bacterium]